MKNDYRELLEKTSSHGRREHAGLVSRVVPVFGFVVAAYIYLVSVTMYGASLVAAIGASATHHGIAFSPMDWALIAMFAALFVTVSAAWPKIPEVVAYFWTQFEDAIGRIIVPAHSLCHICFPDRLWFFRKVFGWVTIFVVIAGALTCFRWTASQLPALPKNIDVSSAITQFVTPQMFKFVSGLLIGVMVTVIAMRFGFSSKWRMVFDKPVCEEAVLSPTIAAHSTQPIRILHASDLHITDGQDVPLTEGSQHISDALVSSVLLALKRDSEDCAAVLLTGDITDRGSGKSWTRFLDACPVDLKNKMILVPGNHDLNLQQGRFPTRAERLDSFGRRMRQIRAMCSMAEVMGGRAYLIDRRTRRCISLSEYVDRQRAALEAHIDGTLRARRPMTMIWEEMFPLVALIKGTRVGVVILDTVKPASINVTNAIGAVPAEAIDACNELMAQMSTLCDSFVFAIHHHVAMPYAKKWWSRVQNAFLVFQNAVQLVDMLSKRGEPTIVFHGHRHVAYTGKVQDTEINIVASPSATVGAHARPGEGSWRLVELQASSGACRLIGPPQFRSLIVHGQDVKLAL
ncbi:3',5'-cyclic adenosine monophosphate phosphodiesterase CpdA [Paraburkholderia aspalathi]|uniref:metallophosphoesterase family protein n=1 Tax=Paraburkholderia aspalathi TaxID=1324617 RepID=UPI001B0F4140|nr:metallophosphoesterase [Paraburkholderia aspalathi]CAE6872507.1 3',5'-cyclic adenosine monophosphate phosphodiesterase CpdA [Paraburkholderia aspalathi]